MWVLARSRTKQKTDPPGGSGVHDVVTSSSRWRRRVATLVLTQFAIALVVYVQDFYSTTRRGHGVEWDDLLTLVALALLIPTTVAILVSERRYRKLIDRALVVERERSAAHEALKRGAEDRRELLGHLVRAKEEERRRVASDIHDDSVQMMTSVAINLEREARHASDPRLQVALRELEDVTRAAIGRLREMVFDLRPRVLDDEGLVPALTLYLEELALDTGAGYEIRNELGSEPPDVDRTVLFRIAQEALANVRKHARARRVEVRLSEKGDGIEMIVRDDGAGFDPERVDRHLHVGVAEMQERAEIHGGRLEIESAPGRGTTVSVWIPTSLG